MRITRSTASRKSHQCLSAFTAFLTSLNGARTRAMTLSPMPFGVHRVPYTTSLCSSDGCWPCHQCLSAFTAFLTPRLLRRVGAVRRRHQCLSAFTAFLTENDLPTGLPLMHKLSPMPFGVHRVPDNGDVLVIEDASLSPMPFGVHRVPDCRLVSGAATMTRHGYRSNAAFSWSHSKQIAAKEILLPRSTVSVPGSCVQGQGPILFSATRGLTSVRRLPDPAREQPDFSDRFGFQETERLCSKHITGSTVSELRTMFDTAMDSSLTAIASRFCTHAGHGSGVQRPCAPLDTIRRAQ
jgi:hypothetical protein